MRITGGIHRSRALRAPRGDATRPTSDRVREALFSTLASAGALEGARVLDLYAGTGALGLEALSRGASSATWVESGRDALVALRANVEALGATASARIVRSPVERAATQLVGNAFDLIFADPPYADVPSGALARALAPWLSAEPPFFSSGAILVLEHASRDTAPALAPFVLAGSRRYGDSTLSTYEFP